MPKITALTDDLCRYLINHRSADDDILKELRAETFERVGELGVMMIPEDAGTFLSVLVGALAPKFAVEVGTFTGYSSIYLARSLAPGGKLLCCDVSEEWTSLGKPYWQRAGLAERIDLRIAPAIETLRALPDEQIIDFAFIDADKANYIAYYEEILKRMRPNGMIAIDNVLWHNWLMDAANQDAEAVGVREFNDHILGDNRVQSSMIHVSDGITLIRKL